MLGLTALRNYMNQRYLRLQQSIGLMFLALGFSILVAFAMGLGLLGDFAGFKNFISQLSLSETLLKGVLCFILFAGNIDVKVRTLGEEKWVVLALSIGVPSKGHMRRARTRARCAKKGFMSSSHQIGMFP